MMSIRQPQRHNVMKADYLELTDGRKVRVLWNMNALGEYTSVTGKEMSDLAEVKADVGTLRIIAWCSAREGEEAEGRILDLDERQFGRLIDMAGIVRFSEILTKQTQGAAQKKSKAPVRFPLIHFRKKG